MPQQARVQEALQDTVHASRLVEQGKSFLEASDSERPVTIMSEL